MSAASVVSPPTTHKPVRFDQRLAVAGGIVFIANAELLVLHAVAGRLLAPFVGSSLETWAAVIAAFLAGLAVGSAFGGRAADRKPTAGTLSVWLLVGAMSAVWVVLLPILLNNTSLHTLLPLGPRIPVLAFLLGFPAGFALGVLSPLAVRIGRVGWLVVALAVVGGLTGHVVASLVLLPAFTLNQIVIGTAAVLCVLAAAVSAVRLNPPAEVERRLHPALMPPELPPAPFPLSAAITWSATGTAAGVALGTFVLSAAILVPVAAAVLATAAVAGWKRANLARVLCVAGGVTVGGLMVLVNAHPHSVETDDAEPFPLEAVYAAKDAHPDSQRVLVIGGGSAFPRCVREKVPTAAVEMVDNGRPFVTERAEKGVYHVVSLDATGGKLPYHLLTKECNEAVKKTLTDDGLYLVTVRDAVDGRLWKSVYVTLTESFPHVAVTFPKGTFDPEKPERSVIVICAGNTPIEPGRWAEMMYRQTGSGSGVYVLPADATDQLLAADTPILLTDQYTPVDRLSRGQ